MANDPRDLAERQFANHPAVEGGVDLVARYASDVPLVLEGLLAPALSMDAPQSIIEVGFGSAWLLELLAAQVPGVELFGLDLSPQMVAAARRKALGAHLVCGDMEHAPFPSGRFDCVYSCCAIYFARDTEVALVELRRLARPAGKVIVNTVSPDNLKELSALTAEVLPGAEIDDIANRFDLESGWSQFQRVFRRPERVAWRGEMVLPSVDLFVDYWASFHHLDVAARGLELLQDARKAAASFADRVGQVRVTRASGAFVATVAG